MLRRVIESDTDVQVVASARSRYRQLLAGGDALSLDYRLAALAACRDGQIIAHVARSAREPALRRAAMERVDDHRLLAEIAEHDDDQDLRRGAAGRLAAIRGKGQRR